MRKRSLRIAGLVCAAAGLCSAIAALFFSLAFAHGLDDSNTRTGFIDWEREISAFGVYIFISWTLTIALWLSGYRLVFGKWLGTKKPIAVTTTSKLAFVSLPIFFLVGAFAIFELLSGVIVQCMMYQNQHFADGIVFPANLRILKPIDSSQPAFGRQADEEYLQLCKPSAISASSSDEVPNSADIVNVELPTFDGDDKELLLRHLATSCKWRLSEEDGAIFAVRRTVSSGGNWVSDRSGYIDAPSTGMVTETKIGIDDPVSNDWHLSGEDGTNGGTLMVPVDPANDTYLFKRFGSHLLQITERSATTTRIFTNNELRAVGEELSQLKKSKIAAKEGFDLGLMPPFSKGPALPQMKVINQDTGRGRYHVEAFVNPGEPGKTFLKIFEATRNIGILKAGDPSNSAERIGWSHDNKETFFYETSVSIATGDLDVYYPARFELWFEPADKNKPERKLLEQVYSVCASTRF